MEISTSKTGEFVEVRAAGRLDGYWADHLQQALEEVLRQGQDHIHLNMSGVSFISSLGIRVLVAIAKKVQSIQGVFLVTEPSDAVSKVLDMVGLRPVLMPAQAGPRVETGPARATVETENANIELFPLGPGTMACRAIGDSSLVERGGYTASHCRTVPFPNGVGLGLGAFGESFDQCSERFGEFLSVSGVSVYQPSDGSNAADSLIAQGSFIPELQVLYGVSCQGDFSTLGRFEARTPGASTGLSELAEASLRIASSDLACVVMVAESAGLIGANLRKPPVSGGSPFEFPEIRKWLSFTTEPVHTRALALVVGIASRSKNGALASMLRPVGRSDVKGHFHAAAFSYRPLQRGSLDLGKLARSLLENESLLGLKHLIADDRGAELVESRFYRGACWISPIDARSLTEDK